MTKDELTPIDTSKYKITETGQVLKIIKEELKKENAELKEQIKKMKCDILSLVKDRMNDDIDQNVIERLAEKWEIKEKTKEELEREYYSRRPTEPYSEDDSPNDWANIVQYAEEILARRLRQLRKLEKENKGLKRNFKSQFRKIAEQEETIDTLSKRICEQQKTIGSLTDMIDELKAKIEKMKCCQNCERNCAHMYSEGCWKGGIPTNWRLKIR